MTTAAVILAAGASTRLGQPKQLIVLEGETLLDRAVRVADEAGCSPLHVILGADATLIQQSCTLRNAEVVLNPQWREGMASSLRVGIESVARCKAALVLTCDMPAVTPQHLQALAATGALTASRYGGRNGVPAFFPRALFAGLMALVGDQGARDLLAEAASIPLAGGELDVDTPEDLVTLRGRFVG